MTIEQLDLFPKEISELDCLWQELVELKESLRKTRRKLFGEIKDLNDQVMELKAQNERLKCLERKNRLVFTAQKNPLIAQGDPNEPIVHMISKLKYSTRPFLSV